ARREDCDFDSVGAALAVARPLEQGDPVAGARLRLRFPKELIAMSPGFYMALGENDLAGEGADAVVRLYWNLRAEAAAGFLGAATKSLNAAAIPFRLKVVNDSGRYVRCDAGVLYVRRSDYDRVRPIAEAL